MKHLNETITTGGPAFAAMLEELENSVTAFSRFTSVPVTFFSPSFEIRWEFNKTSKFCITNASYENPCSKCRKTLTRAMEESASHREITTFICATGLVNICYAFYYEGALSGFFVAGPVAMGKDRDRTIADFYQKVQEETIDIPLLMTMTNNLNVYSPEDVEHLAKIFLDILTAPQVPKASQSPSPADLAHGSTARYEPPDFIQYTGSSDVIYNALAYIREHFRTITNLEQVASYVHVSRTYLSILFKKETGISIVDYFHRLRLDAALWELEHTDSNITSIALSVGYRESSYFSKLFKERYGKSPREMRQKLIDGMNAPISETLSEEEAEW